MTKFICEYKYTNRFSQEHTWTIIGRRGALHLHISRYAPGKDFNGGLEIHYRQPPGHMEEDAPSHEKCWLLGQPCWHDGSSMYVTEHVIPFWLCDPNNHERMFQFLKDEMADRLPYVPEVSRG